MHGEALIGRTRLVSHGQRWLAGTLRLAHSLQRRLRDRPDTEHVMTLNRAIGCILLSLHFIYSEPGAVLKGVAIMLAGLGCTAALFAHLVIGPHRSVPRQTAAMLGDTIFICGVMHLGGDDLALWYPTLLWVTLGNGFRLGRANLLRAMMIGTAGFGVMVATTPFWQDHAALSLGLLLGNVVIPLYVYMLLSRLHIARRQAQAADRAKSRFLASVSHELRTPLHAIVGTASLLEKETLTPRCADMVHIIGAAGATLVEMVDDILTISRSGAEHPAAASSEFDLADLLVSLKNLVVNLSVALHMGHSTPQRVRAAERQIREILLNLAGNAVKFTEAGGVLIAVQEAGRSESKVRLRFEVVDTGIGIEPSAHTRIFAEFEQADRSIADRFGGTGLGLAICKRHAAAIGGEIGVESRIGAGATFWLEVECEAVDPQTTVVAPTYMKLEMMTVGGDVPPHLRTVIQAFDPHTHVTKCTAAALFDRVSGGGVAGKVLLVQLDRSRDVAALLSAATRAAKSSPALVVVGSPDTFGCDADLRWVAQSWVPYDVGEADLTAAVRIAGKLGAGLLGQEAAAGGGSAQRAALPGSPTVPLHGDERRPGCGKTILVVDDISTNRKIVGMMLQSAGHNCRFACSGEDALAAMEDEDIDLVVIDVNMPGIDGHETVKLYRVASLGLKYVPIVALTADVSQETAQRCRESGMDECITKPVRVAKLLEIVEKLIPAPALSLPPRGDSNGPSIDQIPVLDPDLSDSLRKIGGKNFVEGLAVDFRKDAVCLLLEMEQALRSQDLQAFRMCCHALGSAAANMGGMRVRHLSLAMEGMRLEDVTAQGRTEMQRLRQETERLMSALSGGGLDGAVP
jgi:two-component system, sensor histidine kinase RpfC